MTGCIALQCLETPWTWVLGGILIGALLLTLVSLVVSHWVYDRCGLYEFSWLDQVRLNPGDTIINLTAGFDEISHVLEERFREQDIRIFDFYDAENHTEPSVKRARAHYPLHPQSENVTTQELPAGDASVSLILGIFAVHEIRSHPERVLFFKELARILKPGGEIIILEHLRDFSNLFAYHIGAFHFHRRSAWLSAFSEAGLSGVKEGRKAGFLTQFTLTHK